MSSPCYTNFRFVKTWTEQEIECLTCKKQTQGWSLCSIKRIYKIDNCRFFDSVLKKITIFGTPKFNKKEI